MRKTLLAAGALSVLIGLSACADDYGYYGAGYGTPDVYYDNYYGPYTDGYWGPDNFFYYRGGDGRYLRDEGRHFRHERFERARGFHAHHDRDHDHDRR
jgi:hypothetical protein